MKRLYYSLFCVFSLSLFLILSGCKKESDPTSSSNIIPLTLTYEGKIYHTVTIGKQTWIKENLDVGTQYTGRIDQYDNSIIEKYCYNDSPDSCTKYGGLYQWAEAVQYQNGVTNTSITPALTGNVQGICPNGWHLPNNTEFQTLETAVGNDDNALIEIGQGQGTNTSGFSALFAGYRYIPQNNGDYYYLRGTLFWSSTEVGNGTYAYSMDPAEIGHSNYSPKVLGFSVRCLKD